MSAATLRSVAYYSAIILIVAVLVWRFFFVEAQAKLIEYVPETDTVVLSFSPEDNLELLTNWPLENWQRQFNYPNVQRIVWSFSEGSSETIVLHLKKALAEDESSQYQGKIGLLTNKQLHFYQPEDKIVILSTHEDYSSLLPQRFINFKDWPTTGFVLAWKDNAPNSLEELLQLDKTSLNRTAIINILEINGYHRLVWQLENHIAVAPKALFFPKSYDFYLLTDKNSVLETLSKQLFSKSSFNVLEDYFATNFNTSFTNFLEQTGDQILFATSGSSWLLQTDASNLQILATELSNYLQPKLQLGKLPDGTTYRELVRQTFEPVNFEVNSQTVSYWGEVEENRLYYIENGQSSILTNSFSMLESSLLTKQVLPEQLSRCLDRQEGIVQDIFMLKPDNFFFDTEKEVALVHLFQNSKEYYVFCW